MRQIEAVLALLSQQIADQLEIAKQAADLERRQEAERIELELQQAANNVRLALLEREAAIERLRQDIRNQVNEGDLNARLIEQLPTLASHLPQPDEMHVLQTGGAGAYDPLVAFMMNMRALAGSMGLSINGASKDENGTGSSES